MTGVRTDNPAAELVQHLRRLADTSDRLSESRAALAELRHGIEEPIRIVRHVAPYLCHEDLRPGDEAALYHVAALFAWHRLHVDRVSLGTAFRRIKKDSDSIEGRFLALIAAPRAQLPQHLRHALSLLSSRGQGLDWDRLAFDVLHWDDEGKRCRHQLARDFYKQDDGAADPDAAGQTTDDGGTNP